MSRTVNRRRFLALGGTAGLGALAGCTFRGSDRSNRTQGPAVELETVAEGLRFPTALSFLPDGSRLVAERGGRLLRHTEDGLDETPFLDLGERMAAPGGERGLIGLALHPEFVDNRLLYVRYSAAPPDPNVEYSHDAVLAEFEVTPDLTGVVQGSERRLLTLEQPGAQHNAGDIAFGPDGYLYVPFGDGRRTDLGAADDQEGFWWYEQGQSAQNIEENLLGSLLRIDVDESGPNRPYGIPSDNPLVGERGRDEYYAWGLRNPYRISFDGDRLFVGDVGEHIRESVYLAEPGANYGWPIFEGSACGASISIGHSVSDNPLNALNPKTWVAQTNRISPIKVCPASNELTGEIYDPIAEYTRPGARAVTGGYVYRGDAIPELEGMYVFGDYISPAPIFALEVPGEGERPWPLRELDVRGTEEDGRLGDLLVSFARDPQGEMYVLTTEGADGTGRIRRLTARA